MKGEGPPGIGESPWRKQTIGLLRRYIGPHAATLLLLGALILAGTWFELECPRVMQRAIDEVVGGAGAASLSRLAFIFMVLALFAYAARGAANWLSVDLGWRATNRLRGDLAGRALRLPMGFHEGLSPGELAERIDGDSGALGELFSNFLIKLLVNAVLLAGAVLILFLKDWRIGASFLLSFVATILACRKLSGIAVPAAKKERAAQSALMGIIEENLRGAASVRPLGASDYLLGRLFKASREAILASRRFGPLVVIPFSVIFLILALNEAIGLLIGVRLVERGLFTVGSIYLIIEYNALIGQPLRELAWQLGRFQSAGACVSRVCELLEREVEFVESPLVDGELPKGALGLRLRDLRISYRDGKAVLAGLSLNLEQGRSLGVIGRTGGGKTSLARSLVRLYPLSGGSIELFQGDSSFDLNKIPLPELRCRVALVSQEVQVFSASVRDNLTLFGALPNADDERLSWALGEVGMGEWLRGLPLGLDTELLAEGKDLSAGESQLLALARVFLRDPGLIVLDEASSKIDPSSQARLDGAVARLCEGRTAILIAHRLSTLKDVNDILVLDDGGIAEYGGRAELAARQSSLYSRLLRSGSGEGALYTDAEGEEGA